MVATRDGDRLDGTAEPAGVSVRAEHVTRRFGDRAVLDDLRIQIGDFALSTQEAVYDSEHDTISSPITIQCRAGDTF